MVLTGAIFLHHHMSVFLQRHFFVMSQLNLIETTSDVIYIHFLLYCGTFNARHLNHFIIVSICTFLFVFLKNLFLITTKQL